MTDNGNEVLDTGDAEAGAAEQSFEAAVLRLEKIVTALEDGSLSLEDSLKAYEEGLLLSRRCLTRLDQAELRVRQLASNGEESDE
ncbi:MAG: exodeoxyribonuclease VII small subunit [Bacteroidetes bacterium]|nr:exodeoxyribonuclease VII small subunit [Bacteroidota bacterium]